MIAAFIAAALSILTPSAARPADPPGRPDARPAIWVVNDHDTIIYLFGTFHALDGKSEWFNDEVRTAFSASDELILETLVPRAPPVPAAGEQPFHGQAPVRPGGAVGPVAGSTSLLSTGRMVMSAGRTKGMSTEQGADSVLRRAAEESGKPVSGLESFEFQLGMFSRMRGAKPPSSRAEMSKASAAVAALLLRLQDAWNRGDIESFAPMLEQMRASSPDTYRMMFDERNGRWAAWIAQRMQQPGVVFVAVGAGHLAGRDSVQHKLAAAGFRSARIN